MALLQVHHISKKIEGNVIVDNISFEQNPFQKIAIAGESGAGKTTLLKMVAGIVQPSGGTISFDGESVIGPNEKLLPGHKHIGYLSQQYELLNNYRVEELIWFENQLGKKEALELFTICRINHLLQRKTDQLSGGEKQRIALCMLLVKQPKLLILDEPFSNLDPIHTNTLKTVLDDVTQKLTTTCLLASHNPLDTLSWADEILVMKEGRVIQQGTPEEIYYQPVNEYVAGMFGKYNLLKPYVASLLGFESNGNDIIVRPEHFTITKTGNCIKGTVQKISFWGSFYETEVLTEHTIIIVKTMKVIWKTGESVFVSN